MALIKINVYDTDVSTMDRHLYAH